MNKLQKYPCAICSSLSNHTKYVVKGFNIVRCNDCSHVFVDPRLNDKELENLYSNDYFQNSDYGYEEYEATSHLRTMNFTRWYKDLKPFIQNKNKVLDVGCASGLFLDILKIDGWDVTGIELDPTMHEILNKKKIPFFKNKLETIQCTEKFDLITLFDVIEHIPYPSIAFSKLNELLAPDGIIAIVTPDFNSLQRKIFGKRWFQIKPMEHIHYFSPQVLSTCISPYNLAIEKLIDVGQYADAGFIIDRLNKYEMPLFKFGASLISPILKSIKPVYLPTGSLFAVIKSTN